MKNPSIEAMAARITSQAILSAVKEIEEHIAHIAATANCTENAVERDHLHSFAYSYREILYSAVLLGQDAVIYAAADGLTVFANRLPLRPDQKVQSNLAAYKAACPEYNSLSLAAAEMLNPTKVKDKLEGWLIVAVDQSQDLANPIGQRVVYADGKKCTSRITSVDKENARITTASGSIYALGEPSGVCKNISKPEVMQAVGF